MKVGSGFGPPQTGYKTIVETNVNNNIKVIKELGGGDENTARTSTAGSAVSPKEVSQESQTWVRIRVFKADQTSQNK